MTEVTKAIARYLGWPLILIDPSHFLKGGIENIYAKADEVFSDLSELAGVVILFDEMDALVQTRDEGAVRLDTTSQFLTTSMLPKLATLHDRKQSIFFMATNFRERFDNAIVRPGRFDLLVCMGPPTLEEKLEWVRKMDSGAMQAKLLEQLGALANAPNSDAAQKIAVFTFGDFKAFCENIVESSLPPEDFDLKKLESSISDWSNKANLRFDDIKDYKGTVAGGRAPANIEELLKQSKEKTRPEWSRSPMLRYVAERKASKLQ